MKLPLMVLLCLLPWLCMGVTRSVAIDGTQPYISIQAAIDASADGDIVTVYPGDYPENLNTNGHSITLQSLYPVTQSEQTINSTIIHGNNTASCLKAENGETVILNGFKLSNNLPENLAVNFWGVNTYGGGIRIASGSSMQILNCIITNCIAKTGGGIVFSGDNLFLSSTKVFNNYAIEDAGGIKISGTNATSIVFDAEHPCSIYDNTGLLPMDFLLANYDTPLNVPLTTFSTVLSEQDDYYAYSYNAATLTFSIATAFFPSDNHNLYVSTTGNDLNTGLSPDVPLKTIVNAIKRIASDSLCISTIHLAPGVYNISQSNQFYPFGLKSYVCLLGDANGGTVFDTENYCRRYIQFGSKNGITIENIKFIGNPYSGAPISIDKCHNIIFRNLEFDGSFGYPNCIGSAEDDGVILENILYHNSIQENTNEALRVFNTKNMVINNFVLNNQVILNDGGNANGLSFWNSDVTIRNSIISNCSMYDANVFMYQNIDPAHSDYNLEMSNLLIFNNMSNFNMWSIAPVYVQNRFQRVKINNCTIANNWGMTSTAMRLYGYGDIYNSIFYNPGLEIDLSLDNVNEEVGSFDQSVNYSLARVMVSEDWDYITVNHVIRDSVPLFLGAVNGTPSITSAEYYKLSAGSPCIDSGAPDTTGLSLPPMDLAGNYRVWNNRIDMGCYEYGSAPYVSNANQENPPLPDMIALSTYPNPVHINGSKGAYAFIEFTLPEQIKSQPVIEIFNIKGQLIRAIKLSQSYTGMVRKAGLTGEVKQSGEFYSTVWDCTNAQNQKVATGLYLVKVNSGSRQAVTKMMVVK